MRSQPPNAIGVGISIFDLEAGKRAGIVGTATGVQAGPRWERGSAFLRRLWHTGNLRSGIEGGACYRASDAVLRSSPGMWGPLSSP